MKASLRWFYASSEFHITAVPRGNCDNMLNAYPSFRVSVASGSRSCTTSFSTRRLDLISILLRVM